MHCPKFLLHAQSLARLVGAALLFATTGCGQTAVTQPSNPVPTPAAFGTLAFSSTATKGWGAISVSVGGQPIGTLRAFEPASTTSSCVPSSGRVTTTVPAGAYAYSASSDTGATWSGTVTVTAGGCQETSLTCPNGDCSVTVTPPPPPTSSGSLVFQGAVSYRTSGSTVTLSINRILNGSTRTSGSLRIDLWATATPYAGGSISGYRTASIRTSTIQGLADQLAPNASFSSITATASYVAPPSGFSNFTMILAEFSSSCGSSDQFCIAAFVPLNPF